VGRDDSAPLVAAPMTGERATELRRQLDEIESGVDLLGFRTHPCAAKLADGTVTDCVYAMTLAESRREGLASRLDESGWRRLEPSEVVSLHASAKRLPAKFARVLRDAGESGMGYWSFTGVFSWWRRRNFCQTFLDFIDYPDGLEPSDLRKVVPRGPVREDAPVRALALYWCAFDIPDTAIGITKGSTIYVGAPAYPMPTELRTGLVELLASIPPVLEAHAPQCYSPASMSAAAQCLVVVLDPALSDTEDIRRTIKESVGRLCPPGSYLDVWYLKAENPFLASVRSANCRIK
jgi:hypothetical protein